ncbi:MAG: hypothetical protein ACE5J7_03665 [Candidatus Aenigmatarchaeota archaeon]
MMIKHHKRKSTPKIRVIVPRKLFVDIKDNIEFRKRFSDVLKHLSELGFSEKDLDKFFYLTDKFMLKYSIKINSEQIKHFPKIRVNDMVRASIQHLQEKEEISLTDEQTNKIQNMYKSSPERIKKVLELIKDIE